GRQLPPPHPNPQRTSASARNPRPVWEIVPVKVVQSARSLPQTQTVHWIVVVSYESRIRFVLGFSVHSLGLIEDRQLMMGMSKTEINLRRLLSAAPNQQNQSKLMHYVATLREQLEQLSEDKTPDGLPRVTKAKVNEYYEKIEAVASKIAAQVPETEVSDETFPKDSSTSGSGSGSSPKIEDEPRSPTSPQLRRRIVSTSSKEQSVDAGPSKAVKLDTAAKERIDKHRKLQEDLTDEMVGLARQLKERSLMISQSVENTEKILDSTEEAIEQSLASTGHANVRASKIYSESSKTSCFQWLLILAMICVFIMVVLLIRVT
ncbi:unnamed protein product, partial [Brassica napus]